jgi:hypothetical protein
MRLIEWLWNRIESQRNRTHDAFGNRFPKVTFGHPALDEEPEEKLD